MKPTSERRLLCINGVAGRIDDFEASIARRIELLSIDTGRTWTPVQVALTSMQDTSGDWPVNELCALLIVEAVDSASGIDPAYPCHLRLTSRVGNNRLSVPFREETGAFLYWQSVSLRQDAYPRAEIVTADGDVRATWSFEFGEWAFAEAAS